MSTFSGSDPYERNSYNVMNYKEVYPDGGIYDVQSQFKHMANILEYRSQHGEHWRIRCLPYVYLAGVLKSGTTDLFSQLIQHPDIEPGAIKEPMWWNRHTLGELFI